MKKKKIFLILVAVMGIVGLSLGEAGPAGNAPPPKKIVAKATITPASSASPPRTIALAPFYLIHEKEAKVWIERVIVTVEVDRDLFPTAEFNEPEPRSQIFDILAGESGEGALPSLVKTALNESLEEAPVTSVQLSRSLLLF